MDDHQHSSIYVGNLPDRTSPQDLYAFFTTFGEIKAIQIPRETATGKPRGFAFIQFDEHEDAMSAIDNYDRTQFMGMTIKVRRAKALEAKYNYNKAVWSSQEWLQQNLRRQEESKKAQK